MWRSDRGLRARLALALLALPVLSSGCMVHAMREKLTPPDYGPLEVPATPTPAEGSIWPGAAPSGSFLFFDNKARAVGDLVTVLVDEDLLAEGSASTDLGRTSGVSAALSSDVGFSAMISQGVRKFLETVLQVSNPGQDVAEGADLNVVTSQANNDFTGDGITRRAGRFQGIVTCRVMNVLPGGVFHVRGRRALLINNEEQFLTVEGLVRKQDISINNTVPSAALAEARLGFDGFGVIGEKQHPGWLARIFDWLYPL